MHFELIVLTTSWLKQAPPSINTIFSHACSSITGWS